MFGLYNVSDLYVGIIGVSSVYKNYEPGRDLHKVDYDMKNKPYIIFRKEEEYRNKVWN